MSVMIRKPRERYNLSADQIIRAWETSETAEIARRKLSLISGKNVSLSSLSTRITIYRAKGIPLKRMTRGGRKIDAAELQRYVESIQRGELDEETRKFAEMDVSVMPPSLESHEETSDRHEKHDKLVSAKPKKK